MNSDKVVYTDICHKELCTLWVYHPKIGLETQNTNGHAWGHEDFWSPRTDSWTGRYNNGIISIAYPFNKSEKHKLFLECTLLPILENHFHFIKSFIFE